MPVMSGVEPVKRMRSDERPEKVPVIIIFSGGSVIRMEYLRESSDVTPA